MSTRTGQINVKTQDIFPIIKKWLYSEHDIFLRELVSNACDAITKRAGLSRGLNIEIPEGTVTVKMDEEAKTIQVIDNGLGMTEEEVEKYIANLAFSGAEEFAMKMKDMKSDVTREDIIGKFGLGFYSAFMVADKVVVDSLSMNEGAKATKWTCEGETDYTFEEGTRSEVGTTITLHINEESADFLKPYTTKPVLMKYCNYMPFPIIFEDVKAIATEIETQKKNKEEAEKAGNEFVEQPLKVDQINDTNPLWKRDPTTLKDEDYKTFYSMLYPMDQEPLFWIHLNIDHPFELQGVLYFPKFNPTRPVQENNIKLYSKQVFVSDNVKNIIPEFLGLLKGSIDSVDIPLNVSRSSLQGDPNVKKISNYVVKKVADALKKLFKKDRERFEAIWPDIQLFVKYGVISDDKFDETMREFVLLKDSEEKLQTIKEYTESVPEAHKETLEGKILCYNKGEGNSALISQLQAEGLRSIELEDMIDPHFTQHVEAKGEGDLKVKFTQIDEEVENLLKNETNEEESKEVKTFFNNILDINEEDKMSMDVEVVSLKDSASAAYFKIDHTMKKFQQMSMGMGAAGLNMPVKKTLVINPNNSLVQNAMKLWNNDKKDLAKKIGFHVQDLANLSGEGLEQKDKEKIVKRSQDLIAELSNLAL